MGTDPSRSTPSRASVPSRGEYGSPREGVRWVRSMVPSFSYCRYLSERGIGYVRNSTGGSAGGMEDSSGEDELSDEDGEGGVMGGAAAAAAAANGTGEEKKIEVSTVALNDQQLTPFHEYWITVTIYGLQIVIGDTSLPGSISILQALRQYSPLMQEEGGGGGAIGQSLWMSTHTLYYRSVAPKEETTQGTSPSASVSQCNAMR